MRCFLAVELPSVVKARLGELAGRLRPFAKGVRWVGPEQMHLTLHFFGDIPNERLAVIDEVVAPLCARRAPLRLAVRGAGSFGSSGAVRVLWAGLGEESGDLRSFQSELENGLGSAGFAREERPFSPHLTLGRAREPRRDPGLQEQLAREVSFDAGAFEVDHLTLFSSQLTPGGAVYAVVKKWRLGD